MLKQKRQLFEFLFMAADLLVITGSWLFAYWLRFNTSLIPPDKGIPSFESYVSMILFIWLIWAFVFKRMGLYRPMRGVSRQRELWTLINANAFAIVLFIAITYLFREKSVPYSRLVFVIFGITATVMTMIERSTLRFLLRDLRRRGYNLRYMLIVGAGKVAGDIAARVRMHSEMGIQLLGCLSKTGEEKRGPKGIPILGRYEDVSDLLHKMEIDQLIVALPLEDNNRLTEIMERVGDQIVDIKIIPDIYQFVSVGGTIEEFDGLPVISLQTTPLEGLNLFVKRVVDIISASALILLLSPLLLVIGLLVKLTSKGPMLYSQERVSVDGTPFTIFKFRTMTSDAESSGPGWTTPGDSRVTKIGAILRSTSLDELPQLFNVLRGDMSIVGPRPERPVYIKEFRKRIPHYMLRHKVPAGMTGWAQVHGWRGDTSIDKRIEFDLYYIENWSLFLDLKILWLTLFAGFRNKNAY